MVKLEEKALEFRPKLLIVGASAYSRDWDYAAFRAIADKVLQPAIATGCGGMLCFGGGDYQTPHTCFDPCCRLCPVLPYLMAVFGAATVELFSKDSIWRVHPVAPA
jgi:hypothetical protein